MSVFPPPASLTRPSLQLYITDHCLEQKDTTVQVYYLGCAMNFKNLCEVTVKKGSDGKNKNAEWLTPPPLNFQIKLKPSYY